jgi:hypothetical protein
MLNFSMHQSGIDCKCPYSNRPLKPLTPLIGSTQSLFIGTHANPLIYLIGTHANPLIYLIGTCVLLLTCITHG